MKKIIALVTMIAALVMAGCSNPGLTGSNNETANDSAGPGTVQFAWGQNDSQANSLGSSFSSVTERLSNDIATAKKVVVTIEDENGVVVFNNKQLNLMNFGGSFISEAVTLNTGSYTLTEYMVLDQSGDVIFATPKEGSLMAQHVSDSLPIPVPVSKDTTTKVSPEILDVSKNNAADFGYATFSFNVVELFDFVVSVMIYDEQTENIILTDAAMEVTVDAKTYTYTLANTQNGVQINDVAADYAVTIKKDGYNDYTATYTNAQMKAFFDLPLLVTLEKAPAPMPNLVAEYLFNGNANDTSGNGLNGTVYGATLTADRKGNPNGAYYFRGTYVFSGFRADHIKVSDNDLLEASNVRSICAWVNKAGDDAGYGQNHSVLTKYRSDTPAEGGYLMKYTGGQASAFYKIDAPNLQSPVIGNNQWVFIVSTYDPATEEMNLYVNGEKVATGTGPILTDNTNVDLLIGACTTSDWSLTMNSPFYGDIDDVRLYDGPLTAGQVQMLYNE